MTLAISPNTLIPPKSPSLPVGPLEYDQRYQDQLLNILRLYFNTLDNTFGSLLGVGGGGGKFIRSPYGAFQSGVDQTATANTATIMTFNVTDYSNDVSLGTVTVPSTSKITVAQAGIYNLQWSGQFENADTQLHDASVWIRVNGADVVGSNSITSVPNKHGGINGHTIAAWNYFVQLNAGDYVQLMWSTDDVQVSLQYYAAGTSPTRPTTASVIATLTFVSALP